MEVVVCPSCGEENPARFRLCGFCGAVLAPVLPTQEVRKTVTIVFSDLKGSTSLGESLDPEALREVMTRYFDAMRTVLEAHGGTIEKFIGDAVMAVFGLPKLHEDDALRAVRAAHGMQQALDGINADLLARYGVTLTNRTGVNTGEVVAGDPTAGQRLVTGDTVNVAARLEQAAPANEVLIGGLTYELVRGAVDVELVEPLDLKGKAERVAAYRLVGLRVGTPIAAPAESPLVGREIEMGVLATSLDRAIADRSCGLVTVIGDAGVGKSRLIREFIGGVVDDATALRGRCLPYGEGITFWPVAEAIRSAAGIDDDDPADEASRKVTALLAADDPDRHAISERVSAAMGLIPVQVPVTEIFWAIRKLLERLAVERPLILLIDDIHSAEPTLLELIEHLLDTTQGAALLLLCSARTEFLDAVQAWPDHPSAARIELRPLTAEATEGIIDRLLGEVRLRAGVRRRIVETAEGNPLFVEQMVSMLIDRGVIDDRTVADDVAVPASIQALLAARLDHLSREERAVIEPASVIGLIFPEPAIMELVPPEFRATVPGHLEALDRKRFVVPVIEATSPDDDAAYRFQHILVRDAAYHGQLKRSRATLHERFVTWAERVNRERSREQEFEEILGYHLEQAYRYRMELGPLDDAGRAIGRRGAAKLTAAGRRAFGRGDMPAATNLLRRAVSLLPEDDPDRIEILPDLADALMEHGEFDEATATLQAAQDAAGRIGDSRLSAQTRLSRLALDMLTGTPGGDLPAIDEATATIGVFETARDEAGLARAHRLLMILYGTAGRYDDAAEAAERVVDHATLAGDPRMAARGAVGYATAALSGMAPVSVVLPRCEALAERVRGDRRAEAVIDGNLAQMHAMRGDFERARRLSTQAQVMLTDLGQSVTARSTSIERSRVEVLAGDLDAAERELRADDAALEALGEQYYRSTVTALLALVLVDLGRDVEADAYCRLAERLTEPDDANSEILWRMARAVLSARAGDAETALDHVGHAVGLASTTVDIELLADAKVRESDVLEFIGRRDESAPALREALELYEAKGDIVSAERIRERLMQTSSKLA